MWGWIGGVAGVSVGLGSAVIGIIVEGADAAQTSLYPSFFTRRELLGYDVFLGAVVAVGAAFGIATMVLSRRSRFPRTDALGAALAATIVMLLGSVLLFMRLFAVIRGA